jgi:hypothetical protein
MLVTWKKPLMAFGAMCAIVTLGSMSNPRQLMAQVKAALVRDEDSPGRGAFQTSLNLSFSGTSGAGITVPAGKRLVVDYVSVNGSGPSAGTQPYIVIYSSVGGGPQVPYTLTPTQSPIAVQQFEGNKEVRIYADTLFASLAFAGSTPPFLIFNVSISGHLIDMP